MPDIVKISDVLLQDLTSDQSNSSSRTTINDNFHKLTATLVSVWDQLDSISNILTGSGLGSIDLHSDVTTSGIYTPVVGQVLGWNGTQWIPINMEAPIGVINFLYELTDVEDFTYPLLTDQLLVYSQIDNIWKVKNNEIYSLSRIDFADDSAVGVIYKKADGNLDSQPKGATNTFLISTLTGFNWSLVTLDIIDNLVLPVSPTLGQNYVLQFDGTKYNLVNENVGIGIKNHILVTDNIVVPVDYQYIVYNELILEGTMDVEGEVVVL